MPGIAYGAREMLNDERDLSRDDGTAEAEIRAGRKIRGL